MPLRFHSSAMSGMPRPRRGLAMLAALVIIVVLAIIGTTMVSSVDLHAKSTRNETEAIRLQQVADAGLAHAIALLHEQVTDDPLNDLIRGADKRYGTADDGLFVGFGIPVADQISATGVQLGTDRYFVTIADDPADDKKPDTDKNNQVMLSCRVVAASGGSTEVRAIVARDPLPNFALALGGGVAFTGTGSRSFSFTGCGSVYANGAVTGSGTPNANRGWTYTSGTPIPSGFKGAPVNSSASVVSLGALTYAEACPSTLTATRLAGGAYALNTLSGVVCVDGDLTLTGSTSSTTTVSFIVNGSLRMTSSTSTLRLKAAHPSGYALVAAGDIALTGTVDLEGIVRCGGQIDFAGSVDVKGSVTCQSNAVHGGSNWVASNVVSSAGKIVNPCGGSSGAIGEWVQIGWYPVRGS